VLERIDFRIALFYDLSHLSFGEFCPILSFSLNYVNNSFGTQLFYPACQVHLILLILFSIVRQELRLL